MRHKNKSIKNDSHGSIGHTGRRRPWKRDRQQMRRLLLAEKRGLR